MGLAAIIRMPDLSHFQHSYKPTEARATRRCSGVSVLLLHPLIYCSARRNEGYSIMDEFLYPSMPLR